jgi:hypothetical protein
MRAVAGETLHLPADEPFSIAAPRTSETPALGGTAKADADVTGPDSAQAAADVHDAGTALGSFQLGHALTNDTERQADYDFTVRFRYSFEDSATPPSGYPDAAVGVNLYARDGHNRLLREETVLTHTTEKGAGAGSSDVSRQFTLTLGPGQTVSVFVAGQVKVEIRAGRSARGALKIAEMRMDVVTRPAPEVPTSAPTTRGGGS